MDAVCFQAHQSTAHTRVLNSGTVIMLLMIAIAYQTTFSHVSLTPEEGVIIPRFLKSYTMFFVKILRWRYS